MSQLPNNIDDPFRDEEDQQQIHIRVQQRKSKGGKMKKVTTVSGINIKYDIKKIMKVCKKEFACNGCVIEDELYGEIIQLQGNHKDNVYKFLTAVGLATEKEITLHGS